MAAKITMRGQAGGQNSFSLEATAKDEFRFDGNGLWIVFDLSQSTMVLKQGGKEYLPLAIIWSIPLVSE